MPGHDARYLRDSAKLRPMQGMPQAFTPRAALVRATASLLLVASLAAPGLAQEMPFLLDLRSNAQSPVAVRYTPGSLDRAAHVQSRFSRLAVDFAKWSGHKMGVLVYVLSREEWEQLGPRLPYGMPVRLPDGAVMVAAWGDAKTVELWAGLLAGWLPPIEGTPLRGTAREAASLLVLDLLAQVEAAKALLERAGYRGEDARLRDLLSHGLALSVVLRNDEEQLPALDEVFSRLARVEGEIPAGGAPIDGLDVWLRRQAEAYRGARIVAAERGPKGARALLKTAGKHSGMLTARGVSDGFPELREWLARTE